MTKILLTPVEAAEALGCSRSKVYELLRDGAIESVSLGALRRIPADALDRFVAGLSSSSAA